MTEPDNTAERTRSTRASGHSGTDHVGVALFFGPHPDDVELFAGGTVARLERLGHRVVICDLTRGELASNGTPETRAAEADAAARVLGAERRNLHLPDGGLRAGDDAQTLALAACIRDVRPAVVFGPASRGRHPDHEAAYQLVRDAVFVANLRNAELPGERHRVDDVLHYVCRVGVTPHLVIPLAPEDSARKRAAIAAHASQVGGGAATGARAATLVGSPDTLEVLATRDAYWGAHTGVPAAEPFVRTRLHVEDDPIAWALAHPADGVHWFPGGEH